MAVGLGFLACLGTWGQAEAATVASRAPQCMTVADTYIISFLSKLPAWLFVNHCKTPIYFYVQLPGESDWVPWQFGANVSRTFISSGKPAKYIKMTECPVGTRSAGENGKVCYK